MNTKSLCLNIIEDNKCSIKIPKNVNIKKILLLGILINTLVN